MVLLDFIALLRFAGFLRFLRFLRGFSWVLSGFFVALLGF